MTYVVGYNMVGYMPEMEPYEVEDVDSAKRALIEEILRDADFYGDSSLHGADPEQDALADECSHAAEDLNLADVSDGYGVIVGNISYWVMLTEEKTA